MATLLDNVALIMAAARSLPTRLAIRNLKLGEELPDNIPHAFPDHPLLQPDWIWLAEGDGYPLAMLIASPAQNVAFLMRIASSSSCPAGVFVPLLRKVLADIRQRGYPTYMVVLDENDSAGAKMLRILQKAGGKVVGRGTIAGGPTDIGAW